MDRKTLILLLAGMLLTIIIAFNSLYAAGILFFIVAALVLFRVVMQDTARLPDVVAELKEDGHGIAIRNTGGSDALKVRIMLGTGDTGFTIAVLAPGQINEYPLEKAVTETRAVITFENVMGDTFSRSYMLSARRSLFGLLKPRVFRLSSR